MSVRQALVAGADGLLALLVPVGYRVVNCLENWGELYIDGW